MQTNSEETAEKAQPASRLESRLQAIIDVSKAINTTSDIREILECVVRSAMNAIPAADRGSIHFYDERTRNLDLIVSSYDYSRQAWDALTFAAGEGIAGWVFARQHPVLCVDALADSRYKRIENPEVRLHRSMLCVPITGRRQTGVLSLSHSEDVDAFSAADLDLLAGFAGQAAIAIENAAHLSRIKREAQELDLLRSTSIKINAHTNIEQILTTLLESGNRLLCTEMAVVHWREGDGDRFRTFVAPEDLKELMTEPRLADGLTAEIFQTGNTIIIADTADPRVNPKVRAAGIQSLVGCPLHLRGQVVGALFFNSRHRQHFSEQEIHLISLLLPLAAVAIENSTSIQDLQRTRRLSDSLMKVSSELAATRELDDQLAALKRFMQADLAAPMFYLGLYDEIEEVFQLMLHCHEGADRELLSISMKDRKEPTISSYVVKKKAPVLWFSEAQKREECRRHGINPMVVGAECRTCLAFPLEAEGKVLGAISIQSGEAHAWGELEVQAFQTLAHQASLAIRNTQLMQENTRSIERLRNTSRASEKIISALEPDQALNALVSSIYTAVGAYRACATLMDEKGLPYYISLSGFDEAIALGDAMRPNGLSALVFRTGRPVFIKDVRRAGNRVHPKMMEQNVRAAACLPLIYKDTRLGVLWVHYDQPHPFHEREKEALLLITSQAAIAYENARLHQQFNRARDAAVLVAKLTALGDLKNTLDSMVKGVKNVLGCDIVTLYTYRQEKDAFDFPPARDGALRDPAAIVQTGAVAPGSAPYTIIAMHDLYVSEDSQNDPVLGTPFVRREQVLSTVAVPLIAQDRRVGVLFINYCRKKHTFTEEELSNIRLFSLQAAVAIHNAMLYEDEQKRRQVLSIIDEAGRTVTGSLMLDEIFDSLAREAYQLSGERGDIASFASITTVEGNRTLLKAAYPPEAEAAILRAGMGDIDLDAGVDGRIGIIGRAVEEKAPVLVKDVKDHPDFLRSNPSTQCELAVPILYQGEVVGVINVEHKEAGGLDEEDRRDLQSLAAHAAVAIHNARMYQALKDTKAMVGNITAVAWMGLVAGAWRHAIGNSATTISDISQLAQMDLEENAPVRQIMPRLKKIQEIADEIQKVPMPPLSSEEGLERIYISQLVRNRINQFKSKKERYGANTFEMEVKIEELATVWASPEWLRRILDILFDNASTAMKASPVRKITTTLSPANDGVEILVTDTGSGIPGAIRSTLFSKPIWKKKGEKGSGIGLFLANSIIQVYGGRLEIRSTGPEGTTMLMWLPLMK